MMAWADWLDEPCWAVVDMQGGTMGDVWLESEGLKDALPQYFSAAIASR